MTRYAKPRDAQYACMGCLHEWQGKAGAVTCPNCCCLRVAWMDYDGSSGRPGEEVGWVDD